MRLALRMNKGDDTVPPRCRTVDDLAVCGAQDVEPTLHDRELLTGGDEG